ncbi:hypothetical protein BSA16_28135 [Micromonospora sp. Rc5]|nr:hypothetical protein BSA16_28135 [Micromonospora sp. Rc5]
MGSAGLQASADNSQLLERWSLRQQMMAQATEPVQQQGDGLLDDAVSGDDRRQEHELGDVVAVAAGQGAGEGDARPRR